MRQLAGARLLRHAEVLCKHLPPRQPTSAGERLAAEYVQAQLTQFGIPSRIETFKGLPSLGLPATLAALIGLAALPFGWMAWPAGKWIAGVLMLVCGATMYALYANLPPFFSKLIEHWDSWNVIGALKPTRNTLRHIYLVAHLDANKQRFLMPTPNPALLKPSQTLTILLPMLVGLSYWLEVESTLNLFWFQAAAAAFLLISLGLLWFDETQPTVEGANDNASAVSVVLGIGELLKEQPLRHSEVTLLFTGCEEVGHHGLRDFLARHNPPTENSFWIDLELVGAGNLCYATRHGVTYLTQYRPGEGILALAEYTARTHRELGVTGREMLILEEVATLRHAGHNALCLMGYDEKGYLPFWHRLNDRLENLEPAVLQNAARFTWELMKNIDELGEGAHKPGF